MLEGQTEILNRLLVGRTTVHEFESRPLPLDALERAFEAAVAAPNHRLTEPWRFVQVGPHTRHILARLRAQLKAKGRPLQPEALERELTKMLEPAELLAACRVRHTDPVVEREDYAAVACAIENLCLSLWAEGIGTKWSTGAVTTHEDTYRALGVDVETTEIIGFVWAGYPAHKHPSHKPARKLSVAEIVRRVP